MEARIRNARRIRHKRPPGGEPIARMGCNPAAGGGHPVGAIKISKTYAGPFRDEDKRQQSRFFRAVSIRSPYSFERSRARKNRIEIDEKARGREGEEVKISFEELE